MLRRGVSDGAVDLRPHAGAAGSGGTTQLMLDEPSLQLRALSALSGRVSLTSKAMAAAGVGAATVARMSLPHDMRGIVVFATRDSVDTLRCKIALEQVQKKAAMCRSALVYARRLLEHVRQVWVWFLVERTTARKCMYVCMHVSMYVCMYVCIYVSMYLCVCV